VTRAFPQDQLSLAALRPFVTNSLGSFLPSHLNTVYFFSMSRVELIAYGAGRIGADSHT
jgi:hypothetical protein